MTAGALHIGLKKGSLILLTVVKKWGLNSHNFVCVTTEFSLWLC